MHLTAVFKHLAMVNHSTVVLTLTSIDFVVVVLCD